MLEPDRSILRDIQNYDPTLFIKWNNKFQYFELWKKKAVGSVLITPITHNVYYGGYKKTFMPLDNRLLWWIHAADSWKQGGAKQHAKDRSQRWIEFEKQLFYRRKREYRDMGKDIWHAMNNRYVATYPKKNSKYPSFNSKRVVNKWVPPDVQSKTNSRLFSRSKANAKLYDYKKQ